MINTSSNRAILQNTRENRARRKSRIESIRDDVSHQHDKRGSSSSGGESGTVTGKGKEKLQSLPVVGEMFRQDSSSSTHSGSSQLVDLVVEDKEAAEIERVRARKEGGPGWNSVESRHFVNTRPGEEEAEAIRHGFNPDHPEKSAQGGGGHTLIEEEELTDEDREETVVDRESVDQAGDPQEWEVRRYGFKDEEREVWGGGE